jgi:hypothetical protein
MKTSGGPRLSGERQPPAHPTWVHDERSKKSVMLLSTSTSINGEALVPMLTTLSVLSPDISRIISKALAFDPAFRLQVAPGENAAHLWNDMERLFFGGWQLHA